MSNTMAENFTDAQNDNKISVRQKKKVTQASLWASALVELRKRKLDQVAVSTISQGILGQTKITKISL